MTPASAQEESGDSQGADRHTKEIYEGACAGCHGWSGKGSVISTANLTGTRAVNDPTAINVVQIILHGAEHRTAEGGADMPSFDGVFSDADVASLANYVTARFGVKSAQLNASAVAKLRAAD
jgi:mono/diheme cytochrome c family protein